MRKMLSLFLAVIIGIAASVNAFAASAKRTYVSELVAVTASSANDAKAQLEKDGYKLLSGTNVNSTLKTGVYLGYKETDNPDEAITDIAGMNMTGKFSYADYESIMRQNRERVQELISDFLPVIAEFQSNYETEKPTALAVYESLNIFKIDSTGKLMGDYLTEYDFSDEAEEEMTDTFMRANSQIILAVIQQVSFACDDSDETAIERMVKTGPDGITKKYKGAYPTVAKAKQAMAAEYGDTASAMLKDWNSLYNYICDTEEALVTEQDGVIVPDAQVLNAPDTDGEEYNELNDEEKEAAEMLDAIGTTAEVSGNTADVSLYNLLNDTEYGDGTLLDFFKRPVSEVKEEELYPLVDALSEGQRSTVELSGLRLAVESAFSSGVENNTEDTQKAFDGFKEFADSMGNISINYGVDQSVFEDGVAFTSAATEHESTTGESWLASLGVEDEKTFWLISSIATTVITGALVATCITASYLERVGKEAAAARQAAEIAQNTRLISIKETELSYAKQMIERTKEAYDDALNSAEDYEKVIKPLEDDTNFWKSKVNSLEKELTNLNNAEFSSSVSRTTQIIKCVSFVLIVIALAVDIYTIYKYITTPEREEEKIPHHIMTAMATPYGEDYVYYQTVKNLKGKAADTNNHEADVNTGWLVLYTTKDKAAGDPILAENLKVQTGSSSFKEGTSFVHLFNETSALNLTADLYTSVSDKANGTYILFERDASTLIGSAITNGTAVLIGVGGLALGAVLGAVLAKLSGKKKKETAVEA